jgi:ubiquinone/menaquinone biosynthesis C-methylase UbiE
MRVGEMIFGKWSSITGVIDAPAQDQVVSGIVGVQGWILAAAVELWIDGARIDVHLNRLPRPDVLAAYPDHAKRNPKPGFACALNTFRYTNGKHTIKCVANGREFVSRDFFVENAKMNTFYQHVFTLDDDVRSRRQQKLDRLINLLVCPHCGSAIQKISPAQLHCTLNAHAFNVVNDYTAVMEQDDQPIDESDLLTPSSNHPYPPVVLEQLEEIQRQGGWALDLGSGRRLFGADQLVQVEICAYPFTDVVNQTERLPFRDESFGFVFSIAVTEHVKRPWVLAAEMQRVLKRGGTIHVDSAFLQPVHGYPSHYFNMTDAALRELFPTIEIESLSPAPYQHPFFSISWILSHFLIDLTPENKSLVAQMSVEQFVHELAEYCAGQPNRLNDLNLSDNRIFELAAGFTLYGKKR